jgi:hypothetical protein
MAFEHQVPTVVASTVLEGQTTKLLTLRGTAGAGIKNRVWVDFLALGAAGHVTLVADDTEQYPLSTKFYFAVKGVHYVGLLFETGAAETFLASVVLDAAAPAGGVLIEVLERFDTRS